MNQPATRLLFVLSLILLAVACAKKTPEEKLQEAMEARARRDPLGAIILANEIVQDNTTGPVVLQARQLLVECYIDDKRFGEAHRVLDAILDSVGLDSDEGQQAAAIKIWIYDVNRDRKKALDQTLAFLEGATTGTTFWAQLKLKQADYLLADDQRATAARVLDEVFTNKDLDNIQLDFQALNQLAATYGTTETATAGIQYFQTYLDDSPSTDIKPNVLMVMGHLAQTLEDEKKADEYFEKAFAVFSDMYENATGADLKIPILMRHARALSFKGDTDRAAELLQKGIDDFKSHPNRVGLRFELARLYSDSKRTTEAIAVCRNIAADFHNDTRRAEALFMIASIYMGERDYDKANEEYNSIATLFPNTRLAAQAYMGMQQIKEARRRDAATSAALMFGAGATTPTTTLTSPTATMPTTQTTVTDIPDEATTNPATP